MSVYVVWLSILFLTWVLNVCLFGYLSCLRAMIKDLMMGFVIVVGFDLNCSF